VQGDFAPFPDANLGLRQREDNDFMPHNAAPNFFAPTLTVRFS
jgi:hypothetical protein